MKPCSIDRIVTWLVILLEFDFTISIKLGCSHQRIDHLLRITNGEAPTGVNDDLPNAMLFMVETTPRWVEHILEVLSIDISWPQEYRSLSIEEIEESKHYVLLFEKIYRQGLDQVLRLYLYPKYYNEVMACFQKPNHAKNPCFGGLH